MKRLLKILFLACGFALLLTACEKNKDGKVSCIQEQLAERNMVEYMGEEIGCRFFLTLYELDGEQYFLLGSHCADLNVRPVDCENKTACADISYTTCEYFYENAELIGIVGIQ